MGKSKMDRVIYNPRSYRKRSEPRTRDQINESMPEFFIELHSLMEKHGVADAMVITQMAMIVEGDLLGEREPGETFVAMCMHIGNEAHALEMAAYAHAYYRAELEARLVKVKAGAEKRARKE